MPKKPMELHCSKNDLQALEHLAKGGRENPRLAERARLILLCLRQAPIEDIMRDCHVSRSMVFRWRARFAQKGVAGLWDKPRSGKPPTYDEAFEQRVLDALRQKPPGGLRRWDGALLAQHLGASSDAVWRVLRRHNIVLARRRVWNICAGFGIPSGEMEVAGLYVAPPVWIMALCPADEMRQVSYVITRDKKAGHALSSAAQENGALALGQALAIMAAVQDEAPSRAKRRADAINFLEDMAAYSLPGQPVCIIAICQTPAVSMTAWAAAHPEIRFRFFSSLSAAMIREDSWQLCKADDEECKALARLAFTYPQQAPPFIWKKAREEEARVSPMAGSTELMEIEPSETYDFRLEG